MKCKMVSFSKCSLGWIWGSQDMGFLIRGCPITKELWPRDITENEIASHRSQLDRTWQNYWLQIKQQRVFVIVLKRLTVVAANGNWPKWTPRMWRNVKRVSHEMPFTHTHTLLIYPQPQILLGEIQLTYTSAGKG